jgi:sigma-B regulation protein RsbU (phosphoserine phosphatase)
VNKELLIQIPLFKSLPDSELEHLAATLTVREYSPGTVIFREGQAGDRFYIIIEGDVEAVKALGTSEERVLGIRGKGEFIGELSLINRSGLRTASIRSVGSVQLWEMTLTEFDALLARQPSLTYEVVRVLGERLIASETATITDLREKNRQLAEMLAALQAAQAQIIEKEKLEHELQVARQIQMSILPRSLPQVSGYDFGAMMVPARVVGGDFYDIFHLDRDKIGIMIGDVADKGMPSAIFMARTHALLYAELNRESAPVEVLQRVNYYLGQISAAPLFVTVLLGILDTSNGEFHYGRAGHELPILVDGESQIKRFPWTQGQLLGVLDDPVIDEQRIVIPPGGTLFLYTDGVVDERNPQEGSFGLNGVMETLRETFTQPAMEICATFLHRITAHQQGMPQDDDITMLVIKRN